MSNNSIIKVTGENFEKIKSSGGTVLIDFYADWCGPCRMLSPILEEIAEERPDVTVGKVNVDGEPALAEKFGVISIPTVLIIKNGEVKERLVGAKPKAAFTALL